MRAKNVCLGGCLIAALVAGAVLAGLPRAEAREPETPEAKTLALVRTALQMLLTTREGPIPGTTEAKAVPMMKEWSNIVTGWQTSLETSPYALGPEAQGVVTVFVGDAGADDLAIHLFVKDVGRRRLREYVQAAGETLGYKMGNDPDNPWTCWGEAEGHRNLWIGVGVGLVSIEVSQP